jgi:hypothetical protein
MADDLWEELTTLGLMTRQILNINIYSQQGGRFLSQAMLA